MRPRAILLMSVAAASLGLAGCSAVKGKEAADRAVKQFHEQLDKGEFKNIYSAAHPDLKAVSTEKDFIALLEAVHRKLGMVQSSEPAGWNVNTFNFKINVVVGYKTKFAEGEAVETFTYRVEGEKALLLGYNINSQALITK
jgi:hypothetical protein